MVALAQKTLRTLSKDDYIRALQDTAWIWFLGLIHGLFIVGLETLGVQVGDVLAFGTGTSFLINAGAAIIAAPVLETIIFQWGLLGTLVYRFKLSQKWSIVITSTIFALIHQDITIYYKLGVFIASVVFCYRYLDVVRDSGKYKAVVYVIVVHAFNNILGLAWAYGW